MSRGGPGALRRWLQTRVRRGSGGARPARTVSSGPVVRIASFDRRAAQVVATHAGTIADTHGAAVARAYATLVEDAVMRDVNLGRTLARRVPEAVAIADAAAARAFVDAVGLALAMEPEAAAWLAQRGAVVVAAVPADTVSSFVEAGVGLWQRDAVAGRAFLAVESVAARALLRQEAGLDVGELRGRLGAYAHSYGVELEILPGQGTWPARVAHGALRVPSPVQVFGDARDTQLVRVVVARAAARLAAQLDVDGLTEGEADLLDLFETRRVDAALRRRLPGLGLALDLVATAPVTREQALSRQPEALQVRRLLAAWALRLPAPPAASAAARGVFQAIVDELVVLDADGCTAATSFRLARELTAVIADLGPAGERLGQPGEVRFDELRRPSASDQAGDGADRDGHDEAEIEGGPDDPESASGSPDDASDREPRPGEDPAEDRRAAGDGARDEPGSPESASEADRGPAEPAGDPAPSDPSAPDPATASEASDDAAAAPAGAYARDDEAGEGSRRSPPPSGEVLAAYPEWDPGMQELRPDWAQVREQPIRTRDPGFAERTLTHRAASIRALRNVFLALRTEGDRPARRQLDGPDLDLDAAIAESVDRRAGRLSDGRHYQRPHQRGRDVAVALLVDLSSSTREVLPGGMRIVDVEKEAVLCLGEALVAAGDRFAVLGFSGHGREDVHVSVAKDFAEPWDPKTRAGVGALRPLLENRDGAAIRHATARLLAEDARTRLLLLLSDGRPLDCGDPAYHGEYARADTADALRTARSSGIRTLCLTVAPEGTDALDRLYGRGAYVVVRDPGRLAEQVGHHYASWSGH